MKLAPGNHTYTYTYIHIPVLFSYTYICMNILLYCYVFIIMLHCCTVTLSPLLYIVCMWSVSREGDIATCFADTKKAADVLHWTAKRNLDDMCRGNKYCSLILVFFPTCMHSFLWKYLFYCVFIYVFTCVFIYAVFLLFVVPIDLWKWQSMNPQGFQTKLA